MLGILVSVLALSLAAIIFVLGLNRGWLSVAAKSSSSWAALFLFDFEALQALYRILLYRVLIAVCIACGCYFFITSNHFILSLDIIFFLSTLLLILHHKFKMAKSLPTI